jgi:hypothetical protein
MIQKLLEHTTRNAEMRESRPMGSEMRESRLIGSEMRERSRSRSIKSKKTRIIKRYIKKEINLKQAAKMLKKSENFVLNMAKNYK